MHPKIIEFAELIKKEGGKAFLVGGSVRDGLLGLPVSDFDFEVFDIEAPQLLKICQEFGSKVDLVGQSFGILKVQVGNEVFDVSLPRIERKVGVTHKDFAVSTDPYMPYEDACRRRDFTCNALMQDPLTGEILDFFGGREDIKNKIIRHVDANTFVEDSLRVLRACGFAARFNFSIAADTITLCKSIDLNDLPAERIREELFKLLLKSENPSIGIWYLMETGANKVIGLKNPSLKALDAAVRINILESAEQRLTLLLAILLENISTALKVLDKLQIFTINGYDVQKQVLLLLEYQDKINMVRTRANYLKLANTGVDIRMLALLGIAHDNHYAVTFVMDYNSMNIEMENGKVKSILMGQHLLDLGFPAGPQMGKILKNVFEEQLKDEIHSLESALDYVQLNYSVS